MFNGKKIARLSTQLATQIERINALELANANLQSELLRHRGLLKEISLTLPEMTDTINTIREALPKGTKTNAEPISTPVVAVDKAPSDRRFGLWKNRGSNLSR